MPFIVEHGVTIRGLHGLTRAADENRERRCICKIGEANEACTCFKKHDQYMRTMSKRIHKKSSNFIVREYIWVFQQEEESLPIPRYVCPYSMPYYLYNLA